MDISLILHVTSNGIWEAQEHAHKKAVENHSLIYYQSPDIGKQIKITLSNLNI